MKVVHVLKRIEMIDEDIKDLRKLEKSLKSGRSFSSPIYMSIEKQINIMLDERIKMINLKIENPPASLVEAFEDNEIELETEKKDSNKATKKKVVKKSPKKATKKTVKVVEEEKPKPVAAPPKKTYEEDDDDSLAEFDEIQMLTQDMIDAKIKDLEEDDDEDDRMNLLDIALQKGSLTPEKQEEANEERKKVKFFKNNFPARDY